MRTSIDEGAWPEEPQVLREPNTLRATKHPHLTEKKRPNESATLQVKLKLELFLGFQTVMHFILQWNLNVFWRSGHLATRTEQGLKSAKPRGFLSFYGHRDRFVAVREESRKNAQGPYGSEKPFEKLTNTHPSDHRYE